MSKHILITGASRGIGFETAKVLAEHHHKVVVVARSQDKLEQLKSAHPTFIHALTLDLSNKNAGEQIVEHLHRLGIQLDALIHNAGLLINKPFEDLTESDWQNQMEVNLMAPIRLTKKLILCLNSGSHIVSISSMGGFQGSDKFPGLSAYSVSKGALSILTECLAVELKDKGISANCLCLGAVQTEMLENAFPGLSAPVQPEEMGKYIAEFSLSGHQFYNGKILPVALSNPS